MQRQDVLVANEASGSDENVSSQRGFSAKFSANVTFSFAKTRRCFLSIDLQPAARCSRSVEAIFQRTAAAILLAVIMEALKRDAAKHGCEVMFMQTLTIKDGGNYPAFCLRRCLSAANFC